MDSHSHFSESLGELLTKSPALSLVRMRELSTKTQLWICVQLEQKIWRVKSKKIHSLNLFFFYFCGLLYQVIPTWYRKNFFDQSKIHAVRYFVEIRDGFKILAGTVDNITGTVWTPWQSEFSNVKAFSWMVQCKKGERESLSWSSYFPVSKR